MRLTEKFRHSFKKIFFTVALAIPFSVCASSNELFKNRDHFGFEYYRPDEFFQKFHSPYFREMEKINPETNLEISYLMNFLMHTGIPIGIGTNSNVQSIFELYLPFISRGDGQLGPVLGVHRETEVGNLYFIIHDAVHHFVGIPGPRLKDLKDKANSRERFIQAMLKKEQVATANSLLDFIRLYWNWREEFVNGRSEGLQAFKDWNRGIVSIGKSSRQKYVDLIGDFVFGRSLAYADGLFDILNLRDFRQARRAGVPLATVNLSGLIGVRAESYVNKIGMPILEPVFAYYREVGYRGFQKYSEATADFILQDWYVKWADRFQFGVPLDELEARADEAIQTLKNSELLGSKIAPKPFEFETQYLRNENALLGRKLAELKEMARLQISKANFSSKDAADLDALYERAASLNDRILKVLASAEIHEGDLNGFRQEYETILSDCERRFPVSIYIPYQFRQPFIRYDAFWKDPSSVGLPRYGHNSNGISPAAIRNLVALKREAPYRWKARSRLRLEKLLTKIPGNVDFTGLQDALAEHYLEAQTEMPILQTNESSAGPVYLRKLDDFQNLLQAQIEQVALPQISEALQLDSSARAAIELTLKNFVNASAEQLDRLKEEYTNLFLSPQSSGRGREFGNHEVDTVLRIDENLELVRDLLTKTSDGKQTEDLLPILAKIQFNSQGLRSPEEPSTQSGVARGLKMLLPVGKYRYGEMLRTIWSALPFGRRNSDLDRLARKSNRPFMRDPKQSRFDLRGWQPEGKVKDGIYFLAMNHEQPGFDIKVAVNTLRSMGMEKIFLLTRKSFWPSSKDPSLIFVEDDKPMEILADRIRKCETNRIGVIVFPEGTSPFLYSHFPIAAKSGGFVMARKIATQEKDVRKTYWITGQTNGFDHLTSENPIRFELTLSEPEEVPSDLPLAKSDVWVNQKRLEFENRINAHRAEKQVDLINRRDSKDAQTPVSSPVRPYLLFSQWYGGEVLKECGSELIGLGGSKSDSAQPN